MRLINITFFILICNIFVQTRKGTTRPKSPKPKVVKLEDWEKITVHMVPPANWETLNIPQRIKSYMEHTWSQSSYTDKCSEDNPLHIVPVYFWPGDKVDLPCLMCELAFVFNGKMKMWGKATNILKFLENPKATLIRTRAVVFPNWRPIDVQTPFSHWLASKSTVRAILESH
ncbi:unnamed protein product [Cylicostephanus goldi]|uniref:Uncharacterized protein n=1 Tax=Cylicostephanus goldi TaxID=71465 RepID=A0A3P7MCV5_CYLGO|nr:unnamed protein product [Cylicostephanus goldi]